MQRAKGFRAHEALHGFVAPVRRSVLRRGQSGSVLMFVLAMVLMLSIAVSVVLTMSLNSDTVAVKLEDVTKRDHQVDGVLEDTVNLVRNDKTQCSTGMTDGSYTVDCTSTDLGSDTRKVDLVVSDSDVAGKARILVVDDPTEGYTIEVCDWLLSSNVTDSLKGCVP